MTTNNQSQPSMVQRMREIRDEIGLKIMNMTWEERDVFFQEAKSRWNAKWKQKGDEYET